MLSTTYQQTGIFKQNWVLTKSILVFSITLKQMTKNNDISYFSVTVLFIIFIQLTSYRLILNINNVNII